MKVLIACEESQIVTKAFRFLGHEAYSCDLYECSGEYPEWHYQCDVRELLPGSWDLIIAHPPCTFLCKAQLWRCVPGTQRYIDQGTAIEFVKFLYNQPCPQIAIENPIGVLSRAWRKYDQLIFPYQFGDPYKKDICLWLKNLPPLRPGDASPGRKSVSNHVNSRMSQALKSRIKSRFFPGVAKAMAEQWGG
jgi:hypothetical protein